MKHWAALLILILLHMLIVPDLHAGQVASSAPKQSETDWVQELNGRLQQLNGKETQKPDLDYRIGPQDLLDISVFEAPELNRSLRVSANGEISMPLIGGVDAVGLTAKELENSLQTKLLQYMKDPHVSVLVTSIESHPISVIGEVNKPGVFQVREPKSLLEVLSLGQGLSPDAGDDVLVIRGGATESDGAGFMQVDSPGKTQEVGPQSYGHPQPQSQTIENTTSIKLKDLLASGDPRFNLPVNPGDVVEVTKAGIVYVVGSVKRPGGFVIKNSEPLSVLQAIAMAEGLTDTSMKSRARIIRSDQSGKRTEIPINLAKILSGKAPDEVLQPADIVFVPDSSAKGAFYKGMEAAVTTASGVAVWRF